MSTAISTIDGYPLRANDLDLEAQQLLDRTLENCRAMAPLHPTMGQLYPGLCHRSDC